MREVFIISTAKIIKGNSAGSQRVLNIAKSLAVGGVNVFLCSYNDIFKGPLENTDYHQGIIHLHSSADKKNDFLHMLEYLRSVNKFIETRKSEKSLYLYPTTFIAKDFMYLFYFKIIRRYKLYCDINELRATNVFSSVPPPGNIRRTFFFLKLVYEYITYKLSEIQVLLYDGIVVISSSLERYFSKFTKEIIRIPILCDAAKIRDERTAIRYDGSVFKICFAGFILSKKEGFEILYGALSNINRKKNVELYLYGTLIENEKYILKHLTEKFHLRGKIFYMGNFEPDKLPDELSKYHLLIIPRPSLPQTRYGFSTKLSEYLVSGVPVMVTDVSDNSIYIKNNYNGYIVPPGSVAAMTDKILNIIEDYNQTSNAIVKNAYLTARERLDYHLYTGDFINFLFKN